MVEKPTYKQLEQKVKELEQTATELKSLKAQALIANERLQYLFSSSTVVIYTAKASEDYRATSISENVTQITGYEAQEFIDESSFWFDHVHPEDQPIISSEVHKVFKTDLHSYEYRFQCKDRSYIWVRDEMKLVRNKDGNPIEIIGCWLDITKRKRAEEQRNRLILDLQKTLSEVKTLRGFLPICSHCKKIRDDKGYWNQIEAYIQDHSEAEFSHSICQECAKKYYPNMDLNDEEENQQ
ncbi:PAS domain-containing protein [Thermodesulfobacteriota bacterium]